jgi:hypothetical protein
VPKIAQPDIPIPIEQDAIWPQIAINDISRVQISHRKDNTSNNSRSSGFPSQSALKSAFRRPKMAYQ